MSYKHTHEAPTPEAPTEGQDVARAAMEKAVQLHHAAREAHVAHQAVLSRVAGSDPEITDLRKRWAAAEERLNALPEVVAAHTACEVAHKAEAEAEAEFLAIIGSLPGRTGSIQFIITQ